MKNDERAKGYAYGAVLLVAATVTAFNGSYGWAGFWCVLAVILGVAGGAATRKRVKRETQQKADEQMIDEVLAKDFAALDVIAPDVRWLGSEAQLVCFKYPPRAAWGFKQHVLGRTNKGKWFVVEYDMNLFTITDRRVYPCDEANAKSWLAHDRDTYLKFFDMPETA